MQQGRTRRKDSYRFLALIVAVAVAATLTLYIDRAVAAITTPFTGTFSANANGDLLLRGNSNLTCPPAATGCTDALAAQGAGTGETWNNNGYVMQNLDIDSDATTFNSSSSGITLPGGSTVLYAALYWSANVSAGTGTGAAAAPSAAAEGTVKFAAPLQTYVTVTSTKTDVTGSIYQGFADVTAIVAGAGNGTYTVANIQAGTGVDRYAGWALVIAYKNPAAGMRNLRIYDGFGVVSSSSSSVTIPVDGFQTPQYGTVNTKIGAVVYEGDLGKTGDVLQLNGTSMSDAVNPVNNFFNSTISDGGSLVTDRTPNNRNTLGVDVDRFDASGLLLNNATSATLTLTTTSETFYPGVVTFATDLYAPNLTATLTSQDVDGAQLLPGDTLKYTVDVMNDGTDTAINTLLTDAVPAGTTYIPGTLTIGGVSVTDAAADDTGEFATDSAQGTTKFTLGTMAPQATAQVTFQVKVNTSTPAGTTIPDTANVAYAGLNTGRQIAGSSTENDVVVARPTADLAAGLTVAPSVVQRDGTDDPVSYQLSVKNIGPDLEPDAQAQLSLPAGVTASSTLPSGCTATGQVVTCDLGPLAPGTTATRQIDASASSSAAATSVATAVASGTGLDSVAGNNSKGATLSVNTAPTAVADTASTPIATPVTISVLGNDTDADSDPLTSAVATQPSHGSAVANADGTITYTPVAGYAGSDSFTYTASDGRGGTSAAGTVTMSVVNQPPVATDDAVATAAGQPATVTVLDNDSDPNGDTISVTGVTQPASGSVTFTAGSVTYTPVAGFTGDATFRYTITDARGATANAQVTVSVADADPVAADHVVSTPYHTDLVIDALDGATDANGDTLSVASVTQPAHGSATLVNGVVTYYGPTGYSGTTSFTYQVSDGHGGTGTGTVTVTVGDAAPTAADETVSTPYGHSVTVDVLTDATDPNSGDTLTVTGTTTPAHGAVVRNPDGTLTYTGNPGFSGTDTFDFVVGDGHGGSDTGTVTVTVANGSPVAHADSVTAEANQPLTVPVLANDSDPNGDPLTVTVDNAPAHGTAVVAPDGTVTYTPTAGYRGSDSFHYTVSDGNGGTAGATVSITVVNSPPTAAPDSAVTPTDTPVTLTVLSNDSDPSGDPITITGFTNGGHGTVTRTPSGTLIYSPEAGFAGTDTFSYTIEDSIHGSATAQVTVTVQNAPPIAVPDSFKVLPGVKNSLTPLINDTDPNTGQILRVVSVGPASHGTTAVGPNGTVTYTPAGGATGTDSFEYVITDDAGGTAQARITVTINAAPLAADDVAATATGTPVTVTVLANDSDPDHDALTVTAAGTPKHGTSHLNPDGTITYTPAASYFGTDTFTYTVRDSAGNLSTATVIVTVGNADPMANPDKAAVLRNGHTDINVLSNDTDANTGQTLKIASLGTPAHGTITQNADGTIRYTPATGYSGADSFTYVVTDGQGGTATGTVSVTVSDGAPVALPEQQTTPYRHAVTVKVLANDLDPAGGLTVTAVTQPAGGKVTFTKDSVAFTPKDGFSGVVTFDYTATDSAGKTTTATVTITVGTPPAVPDKTATAKPGAPVTISLPTTDKQDRSVRVVSVGKPRHGTAKLQADGTVTYTPDKGFAGTDTFSYSAVDGEGNIAGAEVTVTVAGPNQAPKAKKQTATLKAGKSTVINVLSGATDPDDDTLKVTKIGKTRHGTAVLNRDGTVTYTPDKAWGGGIDSFSYTISDGHGHTASATVTVTVDPATDLVSSPGKLPKTGADVQVVATGGFLVILVGGGLLWLGGRAGATPVLAGGGLLNRGPGKHRPGRHTAGYYDRWT
jgi:uncharacterized repeat protein (TIGR01451 family)